RRWCRVEDRRWRQHRLALDAGEEVLGLRQQVRAQFVRDLVELLGLEFGLEGTHPRRASRVGERLLQEHDRTLALLGRGQIRHGTDLLCLLLPAPASPPWHALPRHVVPADRSASNNQYCRCVVRLRPWLRATCRAARLAWTQEPTAGDSDFDA